MKSVDNGRQNATMPALGWWLVLLSALLLVGQPLNVGISASSALNSLPLAGVQLAVILLARVAVTALGVSAGLALIGRRPGAIALTKTSLVASAAMDLIVYATPYFPSNRGPGETPLWVTGSIAYCGIWLIYLSRSRRVREVFGPWPDHKGESTGK
jgi:hypothetical protein